MTISSLSAGVSARRNSLNNVDFLEISFSKPRRKCTRLPCGLNVRQAVHVVRLLATCRRDLRRRTLAYAIPNENDEAKKAASRDCNLDTMALHLDNNASSKYSDVEVVASISCLEDDISQSIENLKSQGSILDKLKAVHLHLLASERWNASRLKLCHRHYSDSARNLIHYLALRCLDLEQLKEDLSCNSLLNLESINSYILASLTAGIQLLDNQKSSSLNTQESILYQEENGNFMIQALGKKLSANKELLLGPLRHNQTNHIMVTVGQEASESEISDILKAGASIIRINCAHGNPSIWSEIIRRVKTSSQMLEMPCQILMDLAGPKLRTGNLKPGPCIIKISPKKNATGNVILPSQVWLSHKDAGPPPSHLSPDAVLFIDDKKFLSELQVGHILKFSDARECSRTAYVQSGTELHRKGKKIRFPAAQVVDVPAVEPFIRLRVGDLLTISRDSSCEQDESSEPISSAHRITCSSSCLFDSVKPGEPIAFDDGKIWGLIQGASISEIVVSITHAGPRGTKLGSGKSINIPKSNIHFEGLTTKDLMDLEFVASHADMVGISFVRDSCDIAMLRKELEKRKVQNLGVVLKIETKSGFERLPHILLEAMKSSNPLGVMIARGDLAVECGWERLADMQEEILSICGAAHVPVIWATQVLESLVKFGVPTRAEITDVASARRASCVMLNKGKHVVEAVSTLDKILHINTAQMKADLMKPLLPSSHFF
ncbi:Plastidial pyruvate kinase 4 [Citrus sinensis]|uniref:Plastidial pyruvate kinase 4 n=1 Tax=Citrus sinensis TaxID=2711 RepID=A0ACB8HQZ9_CITSI|nr:Plastidial pyruvate kinase 4 [Citrus sinensis]